MEDRVPFDEDGDNGFVLEDKYLPEVIAQILINVNCDTLLNCQLVCSRWKTLRTSMCGEKRRKMLCAVLCIASRMFIGRLFTQYARGSLLKRIL